MSRFGSATKVTRRVLESGEQLRVVGRAGVGVDNIDVPAATARGIVVMNTPYGNSVTTAEHAIALMLATARQIAAADRSTRQGKWEKSRFIGMELQGKTLGLIGCGNIGSIVASRAQGLGMRVIASDPFLSPERVKELGVERVELDELLGRADVISLHTPLNDSTRNIPERWRSEEDTPRHSDRELRSGRPDGRGSPRRGDPVRARGERGPGCLRD